MDPGKQGTPVSRPALLVSALVAIIVSLPAGSEPAFAFHSGFGGGGHFGGGTASSHSFSRPTHTTSTAGVRGRFGRGGRYGQTAQTGETGRSSTSRGWGRGGRSRIVVTNGGGDHPTGGTNPPPRYGGNPPKGSGGDNPPKGGDNPPPRYGGNPPTRWPGRPIRGGNPGVPVLPLNPVIGSTSPNPVIGTTSPNGGGVQPPSGGRPSTPVTKRAGSGVPANNERRYIPDEVVVEVAATTSDQQVDALARRFRLATLQSYNFQLAGTRLLRWRIPDRRSVPVVVRALEADAGVLSAQPNYLFGLQDDSAAPRNEGDPGQYVLDKMHLAQAHELARGDNVLVAVIDSGIDATNPDLAGDIADSFDAIGTGNKVHAHGTAIAGAIAAHGRLMGAAPAARILAVRAFSGNDRPDDGNTVAIMEGLDWAVLHGARVINMSFAGPLDPGIARSLAGAHQRGVTLIAAAGNHGAASQPLFPANDRNVIAVTSTDENDQLPTFANRGSYVAVAAPGVNLMLIAPYGMMQFSSGTSFSAAYVTGTAALMLQRDPRLTPDGLRSALTATAHHLASKAAAGQAGSGLVDAYQAIRSVAPAAVDAEIATPVGDRP